MNYLKSTLFIVFMLFVILPANAFAAANESTDLNSKLSIDNKIPDEILEEVREKESRSTYDDSEVKAWEVDNNGKVKEVVPLSQRMTTLSPPNDGFEYSFDGYDSNRIVKDWTYKSAGTIRIRNTLSTSTEVNYEQQRTTTTNWSVSGTISGSAKIGNAFLGEIESEISVSAGRDKTWSAGRSYGIKQEIPAKSIAYVTAYAVGIDTDGVLAYRKYSPGGGSWMGMYYESAGGMAVSENDANIEITKTEPL